jgi:hypothetical protein
LRRNSRSDRKTDETDKQGWTSHAWLEAAFRPTRIASILPRDL